MKRWRFFVCLALMATVLSVASPDAGWTQAMMGGRGGMMNGWGMMGPVMWIFMLLLWGFAIFGLVCAVRWLAARGRDGKEQGGSATPLDILKSRYAKGEIGKEEFERMKKELE